ncbi:MAG: hypothetical protein K0S61_2439 [Anaerocolumna sp.]|jgi:hypothetical protein|nr:hypothetical protein [Anaerocolumna sp.]
MKSRKYLTLIFSLTFALFILMGCQNQKNPKHTDNQVDENKLVKTEDQGQANNSENKEIGYISNFNVENNNFDFDSIEWITDKKPDRLKELNIDPDTDLTNGFYIYNPETDTKSYNISDKTVYEIIDWSNNGILATVSIIDFSSHLDSFTDYTPPFWILVDGDEVTSISEQYTP